MAATVRWPSRPSAVTGGGRARRAPQQPNSSVEIGTAKIAKLGSVLVRGTGHALYVFQPSGPREACAACQKIWSRCSRRPSGVAKAIGAAKQALIGSVEDPVIGKRVVTYDGWPLYTYVLDTTKTRRRARTSRWVAATGGCSRPPARSQHRREPRRR